jgi:hypothetical protein
MAAPGKPCRSAMEAGCAMRVLVLSALALVAATLGACDQRPRVVDHDTNTTTVVHDDRTVLVPVPTPDHHDRGPPDHGFPPPDHRPAPPEHRPPPPDRR